MKEAEKASHTPEPLIRTIAGESFVPIDDYSVIKQQRDELLAALKKYGKHLDRCDSWPRHAHDQRFFSEMICDCGFDEAKARGKA